MTRSHWLIPGLILLTLTVMAAYELGLEKTFSIRPNQGYDVEVVVDKSAGGGTTATVTETDDAYVLNCQIDSEGYTWPYCELLIVLSPAPEGIDLSHYQQVRFQMSIDGPGRPSLRTYLRNYDAIYSRVGSPVSLKINQIEYTPADYGNDLLIPMSSFQVASWWRNEHSIPIHDPGSQFNNVSYLEVATGSHVVSGNYTITLKAITFYGKLIDRDTLYLLIIAAWLLAGAGHLINNLLIARRDLARSWVKQEELEQINQALKLRSKQLKDEARRDPLTGVRNRAGLRQVLPRWINAVNKRRSRLSIMLMDIDHFKRINDSYGHLIGDEVLNNFCRVCSDNIRQEDVLVRWGGEEFALLCPNTSEQDTATLAEKLRQKVLNADWPERAEVSCSFGVTEYSADDTPESFFQRADKALYKAKDHGRNCVITLPCPEPITLVKDQDSDTERQN